MVDVGEVSVQASAPGAIRVRFFGPPVVPDASYVVADGATSPPSDVEATSPASLALTPLPHPTMEPLGFAVSPRPSPASRRGEPISCPEERGGRLDAFQPERV
jgi:hypothetical protein